MSIGIELATFCSAVDWLTIKPKQLQIFMSLSKLLPDCGTALAQSLHLIYLNGKEYGEENFY